MKYAQLLQKPEPPAPSARPSGTSVGWRKRPKPSRGLGARWYGPPLAIQAKLTEGAPNGHLDDPSEWDERTKVRQAADRPRVNTVCFLAAMNEP